MDNDSELMEERQAVVRRLLDAYFGRSTRAEEKTNEDIRRIGAINRRLKDNDESPSQTAAR
jgi:molybdopterin converting factor small subunit